MKNFRRFLTVFLFCFIIHKCYPSNSFNESNLCCGQALNNNTKNEEDDLKNKFEKLLGKNEDVYENNEEGDLQVYLEKVLENFDNVKVIKGDFFEVQNNYELEKSGTKENDGVLGKGKFGVVYKIKKNEKILALKKVVVKNRNLETLKKEIQNMITLKGEKNIVKIVDVYRQDNFKDFFLSKLDKEKDSTVCFYIIMEFCEGGDLFDLIKKNGEYNKNKIAYQIIKAVYACYQKQIAHRDLKPDNFFLDNNLNIKLGDFGFSSYFEKNDKDKIKCGTIGYASYEVFLGKGYDPFKADLFSLGTTLYALYNVKFVYNFEKNEGAEKLEDEFNEIPKRIDAIKDSNLKTLLKGLLTKFEEDRCGWNDIFDSKFYKELDKKYKE